MADELLTALGKRQRQLDEGEPPAIDAVEGDAGEALLDGLFDALDEGEAKDEPEPAPKAEETPNNVTELPRGRSALWSGVAVIAAAAAALVLWFALRTPEPPQLPEYAAVTIAGGPAAVRGDQDAVASTIELRSPTDAINWRFAAAAPVQHALTVSLVARQKNGTQVFVPVADAKISPSGSIRLEGPLDRFIALTPGTWTVDVVISPSSHAPDVSSSAASDKWRHFPIEVIIASP